MIHGILDTTAKYVSSRDVLRDASRIAHRAWRMGHGDPNPPRTHEAGKFQILLDRADGSLKTLLKRMLKVERKVPFFLAEGIERPGVIGTPSNEIL